MVNTPTGFVYVERGDSVEITHYGRTAATLRGAAAAKFLRDIERRDPQQVMARVTGNYKHGSERRAKRR